jgi:glutathione synthase/RimK-type ligase-like ATP-grasp enzyme
MRRRKVAIVTAPRISDRWVDDELPELGAALDAAGISHEILPWYLDTDWSQFPVVILRSPWDLYWHQTEFFQWLKQVETQTTLLNLPATVAWGLDKRYLLELQAGSLAIAPTTVVEVDQPPNFPERGEFVVKPVTSAGAVDAARYDQTSLDAAAEHVKLLQARGSAIVIQPYITTIDRYGEHCLVFYNGAFDHAIRKQAVLKPGQSRDLMRDVSESHPNPQPYDPTITEMELAHAAMALAPNPEDILYARVDIVTADTGAPMIMELDVVDPVLFFAQSEGAATRFAKAIQKRYVTLQVVA